MKVSIIITNWNTADLLAQCLDSIQSSEPTWLPDVCEVWVVDNASSDASVERVKREYPWVRLIENSTNAGFATANNLAIRRASGEFVLLLNSDTCLLPNALSVLCDFMDQHPEAGASGALLLNADQTLQISCYPAPTLDREFARMLRPNRASAQDEAHMATWDQTSPRQVEILMGACLLLRSAALAQVGLLDESFFMYSEEVDLCMRIAQAGWTLYWVPSAKVIHYGGQSSRIAARSMFIQLYRSKVLLFRKHYGRAIALAYKGLLGASALVRVILAPLALALQPANRMRNRTLASRYLQLLIALPRM